MNMQIVTKSAEETRTFASKFIKNNRGKRIFALHGELGSGKTTFVQGLAKGLGITKKIISPTFIIMRTYEIKKGNFYHIDLYRLNGDRDVSELGLQDLFRDINNIFVIEWPEKIENFLPAGRVDIFFQYTGENMRKITFINKYA